jgi:hypothetical protein
VVEEGPAFGRRERGEGGDGSTPGWRADALKCGRQPPGEGPGQHLGNGPCEDPVAEGVRRRLDPIRVGCKGMSKDVVRVHRRGEGADETRWSSQAAQPPPKLCEASCLCARETAPSRLPTLDRVPVHREEFGEGLLRQSERLADHLEHVATDHAVAAASRIAIRAGR